MAPALMLNLGSGTSSGKPSGRDDYEVMCITSVLHILVTYFGIKHN